MAEAVVEKVETRWTRAFTRGGRNARAAHRLAAIICWTFSCYFISRAGFRRHAARAWLRRMSRLLGLRFTVIGKPPASPCFLVSNHISWLDFFAMHALCDARVVAMTEMKETPILGTILRGLRLIYVRRTSADTPRVVAEMVNAMRNGESIMMCPEGTVTPGRSVLRFHAGLLQAAVQMRRPVHWAAITYATPEGYPPPSRVILFKDPYYDGSNQEDAEAWGQNKSFIRHMFGILALPEVEFKVIYGKDPIFTEDKITLANTLHAAVSDHFTPIE